MFKKKTFLQIKLMYFLTFAGCSPLVSYGPTFAKHLGFSASTVGFVYFVSQISSIFGRLSFGYLADKFRIHRSLLIFTTLLCSCSVLSMMLLRSRIEASHGDTVYVDAENSTWFELCFANDRAVDLQSFLRDKIDGQIHQIYCRDKNISISFTNETNTNAKSSISSLHKISENFSCLDVDKLEKFMIHEDLSEMICSLPYKSENDKRTSLFEDITIPLFWHYFAGYLVYLVMSYIAAVFMDTICFQILDNEEGSYGSQRMFASIGWGVSALCSGLLTDYVSGTDDLKNYLPTLLVAFTFLILSAVVMKYFEMPNISSPKPTDWRTLSHILANKKSTIFACWCFVTGVCSAVVWQYSFWIMEEISSKEEQSWGKSLQGMCVVVNTLLGDVPTYLVFDRILAKIGYAGCMTISLLLNAFRLFAYSIINHPLWALPISMMDGLSFGISYSIITSYANSISTPETKTTLQAVFNSIFDGVGTSIGALCFGFVYNWYGGFWTFRSCSLITLVYTAIHAVIQLRLNGNSKK